MVGTLMYALMYRFGHYYVQGVGYATIQDLLAGLHYPLYFSFCSSPQSCWRSSSRSVPELRAAYFLRPCSSERRLGRHGACS